MAGSAARGWFLNAVVRVHTALPAHALLEVCIDIERRAGRRAGLRWADRTLDVDLLLVGSEVVDEPGLCLPHPSIRQRPFVLEPLLEVWPDALGAPSHGEAAPASAPVPVRATLWRRLGVDRTPG
jgi:2-amino-4-hydroxy-6-hydroxymethyldihydropteridine diphosphokinase